MEVSDICVPLTLTSRRRRPAPAGWELLIFSGWNPAQSLLGLHQEVSGSQSVNRVDTGRKTEVFSCRFQPLFVIFQRCLEDVEAYVPAGGVKT